MSIKLGDCVRIPSGEVYQVDRIVSYWKPFVPLDEYGRVKERRDLVLILNGLQGSTLRIADYQCEYVGRMAESC